MPDMPAGRHKPPCTREDATAVLKRLRDAGHQAYFAGGCVRDLLLGLQPKDYDVATDAPPDRVRELFPCTQAVGAAFGVILVRQGRSMVEVATFRSDLRYENGRRPAGVRFATAEEDARRRDFTINGLFLDPLNQNRIIDFVGGLEDLAARRLRAIGDPAQRFAEDHLRLLRALRFAARFALQIESATAEAITRNAPLLKRISPERIAEELRLMLTPPTRSSAWHMLWQYHLGQVIFRFLPGGADCGGSPEPSIFLALEPGLSVTFPLALAAANLDVRRRDQEPAQPITPLLDRASARQMVAAMRHALRISNDESDRMQQILESLAPLLAGAQPTLASMKRFLARPCSRESRQLLQALRRIGIASARIDWLETQLAQLDQTDCSPVPLITGDDLTAAGLLPGPAFKRILDQVYDAQLEGRVLNRDQALSMALQLSREC